MKIIHAFLITITLLYSTKQFAQHTETINSNIPGMSMSPYAVGKTVFQAECNVYYMRETINNSNYVGKGFGDNVALRYGFFREEFEAVVTGEYRQMKYESPTRPSFNTSGFRAFTVGAKYLFYDPFKNYVEKVNVYSWKAQHSFKWRRLRPAIAGYIGANLNPLNNQIAPIYPTIGPKAMIMLHNNFNNGMILTTNLVANNFIDETFNYGFILTLSQGFGEKFSVFLENESYFKGYERIVFTFGATYAVLDNLQVHGAISHAPAGVNPEQTYGGFGLSWRFDKNYKDIELKLPEADKGKKKE
jgi:hypothetical protein